MESPDNKSGTQLAEQYREAKAGMSKEEWDKAQEQMFQTFIGTKNCLTCKHWEINTREYDDVGVCILALNNNATAKEKMSYEGMGMASETLFTQWYFGCNQHEQKVLGNEV